MTGDVPPEIAEMIAAGALVSCSRSGGKDSQASFIRLRSIVPADQLVVVHAPLGRVEWPGTLAHIRATIGDTPLILAPARTDLLALVRRRGAWPTPAIRQCTSDLKRGPIERELRRYLKANPRFGGRIVFCMGLRADESRNRAKRSPLTFSERNIKAGRQWWEWLPIHHRTEARVFSEIAAAGERPHWVYGRGMSRCSCTLGHHGLAGRPAPRCAPAPAPRRRIHRARGGDRPHAQPDPRAAARDRRRIGKVGPTRLKKIDRTTSWGVNKSGTHRIWGQIVLQMIDEETGLKMTLAVQSKPQNPRVAESNVFQIVTWTKGLGDTHTWRSRDEFLSCILTRDHLIYRLQKCGRETRPALAVLHHTDVDTVGYAFAHYDLLRLEFEVPGDIGPEEVKRAEELLLVELLTYEEYIAGHVYTFSITDKAGTVLETRSNIYGEDYAEHLASTAFDNHRLGIGADNR